MLRVNCNLTMTTNTSFQIFSEASMKPFDCIRSCQTTGSGGTAEKRGRGE